MSKKLFGTDGIRGTPGQFPLDDATLRRTGRALGQYLEHGAGGAQRRVLMGMDTRESGPHIAAQFAAGLVSAGVQPVLAGILTTPGVAWLVAQEGFAAGVVVSASHNPYHDNGVKLVSGEGTKFPDAVEAQIENMMEGQGPADVAAVALAGPAAGLQQNYLAALRGTVLPSAQLKGLRMVLDCANGAASLLAPELFQSLGAQVTAIHNSPDGRNINVNCGSLHPATMKNKVLEAGAALGVAFDGDADRAIFASASGQLVNGDGTLLAMARYLQSENRLKGSAVVGTTMANLGLERALDRSGLRLVRVPVGDRYVFEAMVRIGANLGGEQSGHVIFLDDATTGDGMLTAVKMASLVALRGSLDELVRDLIVFPQTILNVKVRARPALDTLPEVSAALHAAEEALGDSGRVVLRYSGTEPLARVMVEAERGEDVSHWAEAVASAIRRAIGF
jgi:phosphoglucosamine mutase